MPPCKAEGAKRPLYDQLHPTYTRYRVPASRHNTTSDVVNTIELMSRATPKRAPQLGQ